MTEDIVVFSYVCVIALAPVVGAVFLTRLFRRRDWMIGLAPLAAAAGFFAFGVVGWASLPTAWTLSF